MGNWEVAILVRVIRFRPTHPTLYRIGSVAIDLLFDLKTCPNYQNCHNLLLIYDSNYTAIASELNPNAGLRTEMVL